MAGIFAVIPKILTAAARSNTFTARQDAMFHAISLTQLASTLPWDENNTVTIDILDTQGDSAFDCNTTTHIRRGGFLSQNGRRCTQAYAASVLGSDSGEDDYTLYDDLDDFSGNTIEANTTSGKRRYRLYPGVVYLSDGATVFSESGDTLTIDLSVAVTSAVTTNIKRLKTVAAYAGKRGKEHNITSFVYYSTNIGQFTLARRSW